MVVKAFNIMCPLYSDDVAGIGNASRNFEALWKDTFSRDKTDALDIGSRCKVFIIRTSAINLPVLEDSLDRVKMKLWKASNSEEFSRLVLNWRILNQTGISYSLYSEAKTGSFNI